MAGRNQSAEVHALVAAINDKLGNTGQTVSYIEPKDALLSNAAAAQSVVTGLNEGTVTDLVILGGNPALNLPGFEAAFKAAAANKDFASIRWGARLDDSSIGASYHVPAAHYLESWGDARALNGVLSVVQPLIAPLYKDAKSQLEMLGLLATGAFTDGYAAVRETWSAVLGSVNFDSKWRKLLHDGVMAGTESAQVSAHAKVGAVQAAAAKAAVSTDAGLDLELITSPSLHDGRYANNGWLQELPDPVTKVAWDNVAMMSRATAESLGIASLVGQIGRNEYPLVSLSVNGKSIELPAFVVPGHADDTVTVEIGYGQTFGRQANAYGKPVGANTYSLQNQPGEYSLSGASVSPTGKNLLVAVTQDHHSMHSRPLIRENRLDAFEQNHALLPAEIHHPVDGRGVPKQIWKEFNYSEGHQWGMSIDLSSCTGCSACVVACQSENNIPVVGKDQVSRGRELHWMRIDRYYSSVDSGFGESGDKNDIDDVEMAIQPVNCQHCENAPCEQVCPVAATVHDHEGLNAMVYNRCIGTRYCANNCPYKVRRFNFLNYTNDIPQTQQMQHNPDVTVRFRGVMEKCTFCTQRINQARIDAKVGAGGTDDWMIPDGTVQTACQQACPVGAISFGNILDTESDVAVKKASDRNYEILREYNTRPRVSYQGLIRNVNPELAGEPDISSHGGGHSESSHGDAHHGESEHGHAEDTHGHGATDDHGHEASEATSHSEGH